LPGRPYVDPLKRRTSRCEGLRDLRLVADLVHRAGTVVREDQQAGLVDADRDRPDVPRTLGELSRRIRLAKERLRRGRTVRAHLQSDDHASDLFDLTVP